jgi:hypothetical protein
MGERLERLRDAMEQPDADIDMLLTTVLLPPVVEIPDAVANSTRRFVAFVRLLSPCPAAAAPC